MMKKLLLILFIISSFNSKGTIHQIQVWNGYYQFLPPSNITVQLGDPVQWIPLDLPTMTHTITADNIPAGAAAFNQIWQLPADTFFQVHRSYAVNIDRVVSFGAGILVLSGIEIPVSRSFQRELVDRLQ